MIAPRFVFVFGACLIAAFAMQAKAPVMAKQAAALSSLSGSIMAQADDGVRLAQATDTDRRQGGPRPLGPAPSSVRVPTLQCLSTDEARATLQQFQLRLGQIHQRPSTTCPNGGIVAQSPPRDTTVRPGTTIEVIIAATNTQQPSTDAAVPDLQGLTPAEAQSLLRREGLEIGRISRESAAAPLGTIINQVPAPGSQASVGNRINITVAAEVRVPDLRRLSREEAIRRLEGASLSVGRITEENSSQPNGSVIKQWPLPGVPAASDDKVDITIAKGQVVPDLLAMGLDQARSSLQQSGLRPGRVDTRVSNQRRGTVIAQRPAAQSSVQPDATVDLVLATAPVVPNLAGKTLDQSRQLLSGQFLEVGSVTTRIAPQARGTVVEQDPAPNAEVNAGVKVNVVLADSLDTPTVVGMTPDEAGAELAKQLMRLGDIERQVTAGGNNRIIAQTPAAGAPAALGVAINVVVQIPPTVPDLVGLDENSVTARLAEQQLSALEVGYRLAPDLPPQTVILQEPDPGTVINNGETIKIVLAVSSRPPNRPDLVAVPTLSNLSVAQAEQSLTAAGLTPQFDGNVATDQPHRIGTQTPGPGEFVPKGTVVTALATPIDKIIVPNLTGLDESIVERLLSSSFLEQGERSWSLSSKPEGTVVAQEPSAGAEVDLGVVVNVVLSASSLIPDLRGLTPEEATPVLGSQSLKLGGIEEVFSLRWPGTIVSQLPEPDSPAGIDSIVEVEVVGLTGPLTAGGSLLLALAGVVWFGTRQSSGQQARPVSTPPPPPVYGIAKSATARPAFDRTARSARPEAAAPPSSAPEYIVDIDNGNQVIQTDAPNLVKTSIRLRGRADPGEQRLAIES